MKADRRQVDQALARPGDIRLFLLYGPDDSGSRAVARRLGAAMGAEAERIDLSGADLKSDPARLSDEAAALSMFGGARWILVDPAGEEVLPAVEALIEAPAAGNPVAIICGAIKPSSKLLKLAIASPSALAFPSYLPNAADAERGLADLARGLGLDVSRDISRRIVAECGGNSALAERELEKYALYLDAEPGAAKRLDHDVIDRLGAGSEGDLSRLVHAVVGGDSLMVDAEVQRLRSEGQEGITLLRAMLRRMLLLARLRAEVEAGKPPASVVEAAGKSLFWKEKPIYQQQISRWRSDLIAKAVTRLTEAEREVMRPGGPGVMAADHCLFAIARQAARLR